MRSHFPDTLKLCVYSDQAGYVNVEFVSAAILNAYHHFDKPPKQQSETELRYK
jgi:hypothetical protein